MKKKRIIIYVLLIIAINALAFIRIYLNNQEHYITPSVDKNAYRNQFVEEDAYNCGNKIESIIKSLKNKLI